MENHGKNDFHASNIIYHNFAVHLWTVGHKNYHIIIIILFQIYYINLENLGFDCQGRELSITLLTFKRLAIINFKSGSLNVLKGTCTELIFTKLT